VRALAFVGALACALAIGGSRIVLDAHWTTDVCGGFALGACWLGAVYAWRSIERSGAPSPPSAQIR
jgi:membrane-associated phospholipid phosphatase